MNTAEDPKSQDGNANEGDNPPPPANIRTRRVGDKSAERRQNQQNPEQYL
jgi:hypothetical protein